MSPEREQPGVPGFAPTPARATTAEAAGPEHGRPLDTGVRTRMEARFGEDFSTVQVHAGSRAAAGARDIGALAYAVGEDVAFGAGRYAPGTAGGDALIEHELGHVVDARHGAAEGAYRAPADEREAKGPERPVAPPSLRPDPGAGALSLGLSTLDGFDFNGATLKPEHTAAIADVAAKLLMLLERMPGGRVTVTGHTDLVGGEEANVALGRRRAEAARDGLVRAGVPDAAIRTASEGESAPVVRTPAAEPRNRRVEVRFNGELLTASGLGSPGPLGPGPLARPDAPVRVPDIGLSLGRGLPPAATLPRFVPGPGLVPPGPAPTTASPPVPGAAPPGPEPQPRPASPGDVLKAVAAIPRVAAWIEERKQEQIGRIERATPGEKVVLGATALSMATLAAAGISRDPAASRTVLDALDGTEIPLGGGLKLKAITGGGGVGAGVTIELTNLIPGLK